MKPKVNKFLDEVENPRRFTRRGRLYIPERTCYTPEDCPEEHWTFTVIKTETGKREDTTRFNRNALIKEMNTILNLRA